MERFDLRPRVATMARARVGLVVATVFAVGSVRAEIPSIPAAEVMLNRDIGDVGIYDQSVRAIAGPAGQLCVLALEGFTLGALYSNDSGLTFSDILVAGSAQTPLRNFEYAEGADGRIYVLMIVGTIDGEFALHFVTSSDHGRTWTPDRQLIGPGDPTFPVTSSSTGWLEIDAAGSERVAVAYVESETKAMQVITSRDSGKIWTTPVTPGTVRRGMGLAIDPANDIVYAAFGDLYAARSMDFGVTFDEPVRVPFGIDQGYPSIAVSADGGVVLAFGEVVLLTPPDEEDRLVAYRSSDHGQTFEQVLDSSLRSDLRIAPLIVSGTGSSVVLIEGVDRSDSVSVFRSLDQGHTFDDGQLLVDGSGFGLNESGVTVLRTNAGAWVSAWIDRRGVDSGRPTIYARNSLDGGATWGPERVLNNGLEESSNIESIAVATIGLNDIIVAFADGRGGQHGRRYDLFGMRGSASTLSLPIERRIDEDHNSSGPSSSSTLFAIGSDGDRRVYVAYGARDETFAFHLYVVSSEDRGVTFAAPVRASPTELDTEFGTREILKATPDGRAFLIYQQRRTSGIDEVRLVHSDDFGLSWSETLLASGVFNRNDLSLAVGAGGRAFAAWGEGTHSDQIYFARTVDGANTWIVEQTNLGVGDGRHGYPNVCVGGDRLWLAWEDRLKGTYAASSDDDGATFGDVVELSGPSFSPGHPRLACSSAGLAVAMWHKGPAIVTRFDGESWQSATAIGESSSPEYPQIVYADSAGQNVVVASIIGSSSGVQLFTSFDGGSSFPISHRLDQTDPEVIVRTQDVRMESDGLGNVWVAWHDQTTGAGSILMRHSSDGGMTFDPIRRVDRSPVFGAFANWSPELVTLPNAAMFSYSSERTSTLLDPIFNSHDLLDQDRDGVDPKTDCDDQDPATFPGAPQICDGVDNTCGEELPTDETDPDADGHPTCADNCPISSNLDQLDQEQDGVGDLCDNCIHDANPSQLDDDIDGAGNACDCAPQDNSVFAFPSEVSGVRAVGSSFAWNGPPPESGESTIHDVVRGNLSELLESFRPGETCLLNDSIGLEFSDSDAPAPGGGYYYLIRRQTICGDGEYGVATSGTARTSEACPR